MAKLWTVFVVTATPVQSSDYVVLCVKKTLEGAKKRAVSIEKAPLEWVAVPVGWHSWRPEWHADSKTRQGGYTAYRITEVEA